MSFHIPSKKQHALAMADTTELTRQVIMQLAPQMKRRASARVACLTNTEPVLATPRKETETSRRTPLLLFVGFLCGLVLIVLGMVVTNWVRGVVTHWHEGDASITTLDSDFGHGGTSHLLAFYRNGSVIVIEFTQSYQAGRTYILKTDGLGTDAHSVQLDTQMINGKRDLVFHLDQNQTIGYVLYNTGKAFRTTGQP